MTITTTADLKSTIISLRQQLAESQAREARLRDKLEKIGDGDVGRPHKVDKCTHGKYGFECCEECYGDFAREALALPQDDTALLELVDNAARWRWITRTGRMRDLLIPANEPRKSIDAAIDKAFSQKTAIRKTVLKVDSHD